MSATTLREPNDATSDSALHLIVMDPAVLRTHALPGSGCFIVGRDDGADVPLSDPTASRRHLCLHLGPLIEVEDLGSANGTVLRGQRLGANQRAALLPGEAISVGTTVLMVQHRRTSARPQRIHTHAYFEGRLEDECARSLEDGCPFAVLRIRLHDTRGEALLIDELGVVMGAGDALAAYGPGEYEVLLRRTDREKAQRLLAGLTARMVRQKLESEHALAAFPGDGRTAEGLIERATLRARATSPVTTTDDGPAERGGHSAAMRESAGAGRTRRRQSDEHPDPGRDRRG